MCKLKFQIVGFLLLIYIFCGYKHTNVFASVWEGGGEGTEAKPYLVKTAEQLFAIPPGSKDYFKLCNDIDLKNYPNRTISTGFEGENIHPTGIKEYYSFLSKIYLKKNNDRIIIGGFEGVFDGDNHKITNLKVTNYEDRSYFSYALFPVLDNGTIKNVILDHPIIENSYYWGSASALVGFAIKESKIQNCHVVGGEIKATDDKITVSSIVSYGGESIISNCSSTANLTSKNGSVYGISAFGGKIDNCFVKATITAKEDVYGIGFNATVKNSYFAGNVFTSGNKVGISEQTTENLVGTYSEQIKVTSSYFDQNLIHNTYPSSQARTTAQMFKKDNYEGWDFETIWGIDEGKDYPYLRSLEK